MAFKSFTQYQEDKNGDFFVLPNDGDSADVVFLYRSPEEVLVGDVHYISSPSYKGYAHCCGAGCPACNYVTSRGNRGIRLDHKIFIPLYNLTVGKIQFWDRSTFFEQKLQKSVFEGFPNPTQAVFRITRRGEAGSRDTDYQIDAIAKNTFMSYEEILANSNLKLEDGRPFTLPEGYSLICKEMTISEMSEALNSTSTSMAELQDYGYVPVPRGGAPVSADSNFVPTPRVEVPIPEYSAPPTVAPPVSDTASSLPEYSADATAVADPVPSPSFSDPGTSAPADNSTPGEATDDSEDTLDNVSF